MAPDSNASQIVCQLLQIMLEVALLGKPYPAQNIPTSSFPDIEIIKDLDEIVVSSQNLDDTCQVSVPGYRIRILADEEIAQRANSTNDFPYFRITEAKVGGDHAIISLQLSHATSEASKEAGKFYLGGGGVRVNFEFLNGKWQAPAGPMATWMA